MFRKTILTSLAVAATAALTVQPAQATAGPEPLLGQQPNQIITVWTAPKVGPAWQVDEQMSKWNALGVRTFVRTADKASADVTLRKWEQSKMPGGIDAPGQARMTVEGEGVITDCKVDLSKLLPRGLRSYVVLHELGHCLGLADENDDYVDSLMAYWPGPDGEYTADIKPYDAQMLTEAYAKPWVAPWEYGTVTVEEFPEATQP